METQKGSTQVSSERETGQRVPLFERERFWKRQWNSVITLPQAVCDMTCGVILPVICLMLDPLDIIDGIGSHPTLGVFPIGHGIFIAMICMTLWLLLHEYCRRLSGYFAGAFLLSALVAFAVSALLVPFALYVIFSFGGVSLSAFASLGLTPLLTGIVFFRNGFRTFGMIPESSTSRSKTLKAAIGAIIFVLISFILRDVFSFSLSEWAGSLRF